MKTDLFLAASPVRPGKYVLTIFVQTLPCSLTARMSRSSCAAVHVVRSMAGFRVSVHRLAHSSRRVRMTDARKVRGLTIAVPRLNDLGDEGPSTTSLDQLRNKDALEGAHLVPCFSIAFTRRSSSSGAQPPFTTSVAIFANQRLRQSLFVRPGTCLEIACHREGFELLGSSE